MKLLIHLINHCLRDKNSWALDIRPQSVWKYFDQKITIAMSF